MHSSLARHVILTGAVLFAAGCDTDRPFAPEQPVPESRSIGAGNLAPPSNLAATAASYDRINLGWRDNTTNETAFEVRRSTTGAAGTFLLLATLAPNSIAFNDAGLAPSREYCYQVRVVVKSRVSAPSSTACATTAPLPFAKPVTGVTVVPPSSTLADISWTDPSANEARFQVERAPVAGGPWSSIALLPWGQTSFRDPVASESQVCYRVVSVYVYGNAQPSGSDCTTPPAGPTNLTATAIDYQTVDLAWTDNSAVEEGYALLRYLYEDCYETCVGTYWEIIAELPANTTSYSDAGVFSGSNYLYYVVARKDGGYSDASYQVLVYTPPAPAGLASITSSVTRAPRSPWTGPGPRNPGSAPALAQKR